MKKAVTTALVALCFSPVLSGTPGMAPASFSTTPDPTGPPPPLVVVAKFLGLSESQQAQFRELLGELQGTASELEQQIGAKQAQLEQLVNSPVPNPQAVGILFLQIQALNRQLAQAIQSFQQRLVELLTAEQRARLGAVQQAAQLQPVVGAFAALHLVVVPPSPSAGDKGDKVGSEVE